MVKYTKLITMKTLQPYKIKKDQLLTKDQFIYYCRTAGVHDQIVLLRNFDDLFLEALHKDGLIAPIVQEVNGTETVEYYSRFQIFIPIALRVNIVDADGNLRNPDDIDWQLERKQRYIRWCQTAFLYLDIKSPSIFDYPDLCKKFHRFVLLLHSLNLTRERAELVEKSRLYVDLPSLHYDFSSITAETLPSFDLNVEDLRLLRLHIGSEARYVDPLKEWYSYIKKHPQTKKDLLRGEAALAQRCYEICDLITLVLEKAAGEKPQSLLYYLESVRNPSAYRTPHEYVRGVDTWSLQYAIERFREWADKPENQQYVSAEEKENFASIESSVVDYISRYGHRSWAGNMIRIEVDPSITADKLDSDSRIWLEKFRAQYASSNREFDEPEHIAQLVHSRLGDVQGSLRAALSGIQNKFREQSSDIWEKEERIDPWQRYWQEISKMDLKDKHAFIEVKRKETREKREKWDGLAVDFYASVFRFCDLAFCAVCHKKPVEIHVNHNDRSSTSIHESTICDNCKVSAPGIHRKEELPAGLNCYDCGKLIYRYVHDNHFFSEEKAVLSKEEVKEIQKEEGIRGSVVRYHKQSIEIPYGKVSCTVVCGYCGSSNTYDLEYGWRE